MSDVWLPTLRPDQISIVADPHRWKVVRTGRRYGKSTLMETIAGDGALKGEPIAIYAPKYDMLTEVYDRIRGYMGHRVMRGSQTGKQLRINPLWSSGVGAIDFWHMQKGSSYGRGRKYKKVLIDEAAFAQTDDIVRQYKTAIYPLMKDFGKETQVYVFSTPDVMDMDNLFYALHEADEFKYIPGADPRVNHHRFKPFHRPTWANPIIDIDELIADKRNMHPDAWRQEIMAEFVDWSGVTLFPSVTTGPVPMHPHYDFIFAVIDTAQKDNEHHDGCGVMYFGYSEIFGNLGQAYLHILDWDVRHVHAGPAQDLWMREISNRLKQMGETWQVRDGVRGAYIEQASSGTGLLAQAVAGGITALKPPDGLTNLGKDGRARLVRDCAWRNEIKFTPYAWDKTVMFKGRHINHAKEQIEKYRLGDIRANKRVDDLFDCFTYGALIANPQAGLFSSLHKWAK